MKKITLWLFALFAFTQMNAQLWTINSCSNLGSTTYGPMYSTATANANNRTAVIYPSSQLSTLAGQSLNAMYFQRNTGSGTMVGAPNFKIYLKEVSATDWGTAAIDWATEITGATLVYDSDPSSIVGSDAGWKSFPLISNFLYSGTQNLACFFEYSNTTASSSISWNYEYTAPCADTSNSNTTKYNNNTTGTLATSLTSSNYRRPLIGFDFVVSCNAPSALASNNLTTTSVDVSWVENAIQPQNGYEYYYSTSNVAPLPSETPTGATTTGVTNLSLSTLTPSTTYYFWVRGNCGATDKSIWKGPLTFTTLCVDVTDFVENFDSYASGSSNPLPDCWSKLGTGNAYLTTGANTPMSPSNRLYMNINTTTNIYAVLPPVSNLQANTHRLRLKTYCTSAGKVLSIGYFTIPGDVTSYVEVEPIQLPSANLASTQEFTIIPTNIPAGINQLVLTLTPGVSTSVYIDDVKWEVNSSCVEPNTLSASNITNSSADLAWIAGGVETEWQIEYGLENFTLGTGTLVSSITTLPYNLSTGLTSNTKYHFYVRSVCSTTETSSWAGPFTFKTKCDDLTEYTENFDSYATGSANPMPDCWSKAGTGSVYLTTGANAPMSPSNRLYMFASGTTPTEGYAILPAVSNLQASTHRLKFKAYATLANRFIELGYVTDPSDMTTFIQLEEISLPGTNLASTQEFTIIPTGIPTGVKHLVIKNPGYPSSSTTAYIDDVKWEAIPSCPEPDMLTVGTVGSDSAVLSWTEMGSSSLWNIEYGATGFTLGSGTLVSGVTTNPYTLSALTPATTYDYYVQSDCGSTDGTSFWIGPYTFTTACVPFAAPFYENFDSLALTTPYTAMPNCWDTQVGPDFWDVTNGSTNSAQYLPGVVDHTTTTGNFMWIDSSGDITANEMVSPLIDMSTLTSPYAGFWFASNNVTNTINHTIALDVWDGSAWLNLVTETGNFTEWVQIAAVVPSSVPTTTKFRIYAIANPNGTSSDYYQNDLGVDDFFVVETPSCPFPVSLSASNTTSSSVDLAWTESGSATLWNIEYGPLGFTPGTGTIVSGVATNPYTLGGLTPATNYSYYVQSDCNGTSGTSTWSGPFPFTTECVTFVAPFTEGFENGGNIPNCWTMSGGENWLFSNTTGINHIGNNGVMNGSTATGNYFAWVDDSGTPSNDVTLTSPLINVSGLTTPRLTFFEISHNEGSTNATLKVEVWDGAAWNLMATYNSNTAGGWEKKVIALNSLTLTGDVQVRFIVEGSTNFYDDIAIDDVTIEETPTAAPVCATNFVATTNTSCGNEATVITWDAAPLADGYYLTMGTTSGGTDILNNVNIGAAQNYSHIGAPNTTYYYTVSPFNAAGISTGCTEQSFTTVATGCYCPSVPTSNDGTGITNVQLGTTDFPNGDVTYFDHTAITVDFAQGASANTQITFNTSIYDYNTVIWIDFNNDYNFDASEIVYTGVSGTTSPNTLNASYLMPATANLGVHRMRIVATDALQTPSNPCYSASYGVTLDFSVNVTPLLSVNDFDKSNFMAYPNPVIDVLNLSYSSEISDVKIVNLLGQEVLYRKIGRNSAQIDMSGLDTGAYIVNVAFGDIIKSIKVIKQ